MRKFLLLSAVIALILLTANTAYAQQFRTYVVQPGDSLFSIAARFNVSVSLLATNNRVYDVHQIYVGQAMTLPDPLPAGYVQSIPVGYGSGNSVAPASYTSPIYTPGTTVTSTTSYTAYTVRAGDFLSTIAQRFNTTPQSILSANAIADPNLVFAGQVLSIPRTTTQVSPQPVYKYVPVRSGNFYIVQPGDNLFSIAARTGRNAWSIARANGILDLNAIYIGQPLIIP
jgi:LysM repeat protein